MRRVGQTYLRNVAVAMVLTLQRDETDMIEVKVDLILCQIAGEDHQNVVLRQQFTSPTVLELAFADAGDRHVGATFVF